MNKAYIHFIKFKKLLIFLIFQTILLISRTFFDNLYLLKYKNTFFYRIIYITINHLKLRILKEGVFSKKISSI